MRPPSPFRNWLHRARYFGFRLTAASATCCVLGLASTANAQPPANAAGVNQPAANQPAPENENKAANPDDPLGDPTGDDPTGDPLLDLDLESLSQAAVQVEVPLLEQVVTTVTREVSTVGKSPAAVFVITNEMIRRSGATSIPETLRMVPGLNVAKTDSARWAVSSRGFNGQFANKLLVQIDGRTIYTPLFAGVYWEVQDVVLQDIERIEVIRGPGATLWGANAVNGIINIITKSSDKTHGGLVSGGVGTEELGFTTIRYGGQINADTHYRVYGKWFERDKFTNPSAASHDDWRMGRGGFRVDSKLDCDTNITLQGDIYDGSVGQSLTAVQPTAPFFRSIVNDEQVSGGNLLLRSHHELDDGSDLTLQTYYDETSRTSDTYFNYERQTLDFDLQHRLAEDGDHRFIWGFRYRLHDDRLDSLDGFAVATTPVRRKYDNISFFVQDTMTLLDDELFFTTGVKLSDTHFTEFEYQPSARLLWTPDKKNVLWASVSRAVRTPSRVENDALIRVPPTFPPGVFPTIFGQENLDSESVVAYEVGYRAQPDPKFSFDLALFYNKYEDLGVVFLGPFNPMAPTTLPLLFGNGMDGETYGFELSVTWEPTDDWRITGNYTFLQMQLHADPTAVASPESAEGGSPHNQFYVRSSWDLSECVEFDLMGRYVDTLSAQQVPSYIAMDARLAWAATEDLELSLVARNLLENHHREFGSVPTASEVDRGVYGMVTWRW